MKIRGNARHYMGIALSVGLAATAGCQAPKPTAPDEAQLSTSLAQPQSAAAISAQAAAELGLVKMPLQDEEFKLIAGSKPVTNASIIVGDQVMLPDERGVIRLPASAAVDGKTLVSVEAEGYVPTTTPVVGGTAMNLTPIDPTRTPISAVNGGIARNSDGTMEVTFAPGSLTADANVSVTRMFTEQHNPFFPKKAAAEYTRKSLGQYSYHLDLGDAKLTSAAGVVVKFKVQDALKQHMVDELAAPQGIEGSNIGDAFSQDTSGDMWFAMGHQAPLPDPAEALVAGAGSAFKLLAGGCQSFMSDKKKRVERTIVEYQTTGNCDNRSDGGVNFHDQGHNNGHCQYWTDSRYQCEGNRQLVRYDTYYDPAPSNGVVATLRWASDHPQITGVVPSTNVYFSHSGSIADTPSRPPKTSDTTDGAGQANGYGAADSGGYATPSTPNAWTYAGGASYTLNCSNVSIYLIKKNPIARFVYTRRGTATPSSVALPTSHGSVNVSTAGSPQTSITMKSPSSATEQFNVSGSVKPNSDTWVDAQSNATHTIQWNNHNNGRATYMVPTKIWFSKQIGAALTYLSNDDSAPADQRPIQQWNTKAAIANVAFSHEVSAFGGKPSGRDTLSFSGASGSAGTWGINGAGGTVTATVPGPEPLPAPLTGTSTYTVAGNSVGVKINANLPEMNITIREMETEDTAFKLIYTLDGGADKEMRLNRNGSTIQFSIPVEDQLNQPKTHTFKIKWFGTENGNTTFWMANRAAFPTLTVQRAGRYDHPALDGTLNAAK